MRRRRAFWMAATSVLTCAFALLSAWSASVVHASEADDEARFVELMQGERAHAGLYAYAVADDLAAVARKQAAAMADRGELFHNPSLASDVSGWQEVAENVGRGTDVDTVDHAFQDSTVHREHVMSTDLRQVGVG